MSIYNLFISEIRLNSSSDILNKPKEFQEESWSPLYIQKHGFFNKIEILE